MLKETDRLAGYHFSDVYFDQNTSLERAGLQPNQLLEGIPNKETIEGHKMKQGSTYTHKMFILGEFIAEKGDYKKEPPSVFSLFHHSSGSLVLSFLFCPCLVKHLVKVSTKLHPLSFRNTCKAILSNKVFCWFVHSAVIPAFSFRIPWGYSYTRSSMIVVMVF